MLTLTSWHELSFVALFSVVFISGYEDENWTVRQKSAAVVVVVVVVVVVIAAAATASIK